MTIDALRRAIRTIPDFPEPGIQFKDFTPLLADPVLLRAAVTALAAPYEGQQVDKVVGIEARGFILGPLLADRLGAGFVPVRKEGKLPHDTTRATYDLEYGTDVVEMHVDAVREGEHVLIHDDVVATGGTAQATYEMLAGLNARVVGFSFLIGLEALNGHALIARDADVHVALLL